MPVLAVNDRVLFTIVGRLCGQRTMNTFLYRVSACEADTEQSDFFTALNASMNAAGGVAQRMKGCCPANWRHVESWYQVISPVRFRKLAYPVDAAGLFASTALTPNVQASITRTGDRSGRKYIGGTRIPIGSDSFSTADGMITPELKAALTALTDSMKLNIITAGTVATYIPQLGIPKPPALSYDLYDCFAQDTTRVIRRRTVGLGI